MMKSNRYDIDDHYSWEKGIEDPNPPVVYGAKVFAWRAFHILHDFAEPDDVVLRAPRQGRNLKGAPAVYEAVCLAAAEHTAPDFHCHCGWYCYATLRDFMVYNRFYGVPRNGVSMVFSKRDGALKNNHSWMAVALISVSGRAVLHQSGMRVQRIHLEKIFSTCPGSVRSEIRDKYEVKVLPYGLLGRMPLPNKGGTISLAPQILRPDQVLQSDLDKWTKPMGGNQ